MYIYIYIYMLFGSSGWFARSAELELAATATRLAHVAWQLSEQNWDVWVRGIAKHLNPDPWADPKSRSALGFCNLDHRSIRAQNWGSHFGWGSSIVRKFSMARVKCFSGFLPGGHRIQSNPPF